MPDVKILLERFQRHEHSIRYQQIDPPPEECNALTAAYIGRAVITQRAGGLAPKLLAVTLHFPDPPDPEGWLA